MEIIPFPGARKSTRTKKITKISAVPEMTEAAERLYVSDMEYTCYHCQNKTTLSVTGMIFKTLEFFCNTCGTKHKVVNPAFSKVKTQN